MKKLEKEKKKKRQLTALIMIIIGTILSYAITKNVNCILIANFTIMLMTIMKAKFSYFTLKTIIFNYLIFPIFSQYMFGTSYGILEHTEMTIYYFGMASIMVLYNVIMYLFLITTDTIEKEKELLSQSIQISDKSTYLCCIIAIISTFISMPTIPFLQNGERFQALLPGNAWNHITIVALLFVSPKLKKNHIVQFTYLLVIGWFLSHFERVDIIGLILGLFILFMIKSPKVQFKRILAVRKHSYCCCNGDDMDWRS